MPFLPKCTTPLSVPAHGAGNKWTVLYHISRWMRWWSWWPLARCQTRSHSLSKSSSAAYSYFHSLHTPPTRSRVQVVSKCQTSPRLEFRAFSNCPSREWVNVCGGKWPWYYFGNFVSLPVLLTTVPKLISHTSIRHQELTLLGASSGFNIQWWRLIEDYWRISRPFLKGHTFEQVQIRVIGRVDWSCRYKYLILNLLMTGRQEMFSSSLGTNAQMVSAWFLGDLPH